MSAPSTPLNVQSIMRTFSMMELVVADDPQGARAGGGGDVAHLDVANGGREWAGVNPANNQVYG
jgi:hypothetical protein